MTNASHSTDRSMRPFQILAIAGGLVLAAGVAIAPERVWSNLLVVTFYAVTLALGGILFLAIATMAGASWNVAFRRVPEAMAGVLPLACLGLLAVLAVRAEQYGWHHHGEGDAGTFWFKEAWASPPFWMARAVGYVVLWIFFARAIVVGSRRQDSVPSARWSIVNRRWCALFLLVFGPTFTLASCDWIMLLEPMWFSTMWGVYNFSGMIQATVAAMVVLGLVLRRHGGPLEDVFTDEHLHDLGKLLLGFSCFWMYIWFSQYMLIWYANIPEETSYFILRMHGAWGPIMIVNLVLNWGVPFLILLPRPCKRSRSVMMKVAVVVLIGRWIDLVVMVFPATLGEQPMLGLWEVAAIALLVGTFAWQFKRSFFAAAPVPKHDPSLAESLHYHA